MATRDELATSFGAAAEAYEQGRPGYLAEAVRWLIEPAGASPRIVDVGAGTGKLTRAIIALDDLDADVIAVDPDATMLDALQAVVPGVETRIGSAERLDLPDESVDAVVLGQAWHWVDPVAGSAEIGRVLRPGGVLGLIWNIRDDAVPWVARLTEIMRGSHAEQLISAGGPVVAAPFSALEAQSWRWTLRTTRDALNAMVCSRSYVIKADPVERARIERDVDELLDAIGAVGDACINLPYVTHAFRTAR